MRREIVRARLAQRRRVRVRDRQRLDARLTERVDVIAVEIFIIVIDPVVFGNPDDAFLPFRPLIIRFGNFAGACTMVRIINC